MSTDDTIINDTITDDDCLPGTDRRTFMAATGTALVTTAGFGVLRSPLLTGADDRISQDRTSQDRTPEEPAPGDPSLRTLVEVRNEAFATTGRRFRNSPWRAHFGGQVTAWSGMYVSWLLRGNRVPKTADVPTLWAALAAEGRTGTVPTVGSLIFYHRGDPARPHHVGFVEGVSDRIPCTIEGNAPTSVAVEERFVRRYVYPWDARVRFGYPQYG